MKYIERAIMERFQQKILPNKVLLLIGARRVGKTELLKTYMQSISSSEYIFLRGDDRNDAQLLQEQSVQNYKRLLGSRKLLIIDEAQLIPEIGAKLKLLVDSIDDIKVIATGSSAFDMAGDVGAPLVGRKNTLFLYPLAQMEFSKEETYQETMVHLEDRLIFGSYPELEQYESREEKQEYLLEMLNTYLLKDILAFEGLRKSNKILDLLRLIAFQVGSEVSLQELGSQLSMSKSTVERYLDLLSKVFIIYKLSGFSRNLRKEITKTSKWYFYDNGIRNIIINNFNPLVLRNDVGQLWENYLAAERIKYQAYKNQYTNNYFWRTYDQQELDWVEEKNNELNAFEFKWSKKRNPKIPTAWKKAYPDASFQVIHRDNYLEWIV